MAEEEIKAITTELLLEKITAMEGKINNLVEENSSLKKQISEVTVFNRTLLNQPAGKVEETDVEAQKQLERYLKGE